MAESEKVQLHRACEALLENKIAMLERNIQEIQRAASEDTKSSAGDKFETAREMLKQEINKMSAQLSEATRILSFLKHVDPARKLDQVALGSLVQTNEGTYYFAVGLGKVQVEARSYFVLSLTSPLGKALLNCTAGEEVMFMDRRISIQDIE